MKNLVNYIKNIFVGIYRLLQGMYITMLNFLRKKVTEQYPENRATKVHFTRFRGELIMPHNADNEHKCTACGICEANCPNGTINILSKMVADPDSGKERKALDEYHYNIGQCTFCALCTYTCPQDAIEWSANFEHSVFTGSKLNLRLNAEGSVLIKKPIKE